MHSKAWKIACTFLGLKCCLVAEPDKVLVGELNKWVANPLGPGQTSALQIKTRSAGRSYTSSCKITLTHDIL